MTAAISGPKTNYMERDWSWRWSEEPKWQGSPLDLPVEPPNLAHIFQIPDVTRRVGNTSSNRSLCPGIILMGKMTPSMMLPGRT